MTGTPAVARPLIAVCAILLIGRFGAAQEPKKPGGTPPPGAPAALEFVRIAGGSFEMGTRPSYFSACGGACPVEQVSWEDVQAFIATLNAREDGYAYRLPTEAEWEFAARGGTNGDYAGILGEMAWYEENSDGTTHPVGQKRPNARGLYDMHGNVWEWVSDWLDDYPAGLVTDPVGPASGASRVTRGGSFNSEGGRCRSAFRVGRLPRARYGFLGFRLARTRS